MGAPVAAIGVAVWLIQALKKQKLAKLFGLSRVFALFLENLVEPASAKFDSALIHRSS